MENIIVVIIWIGIGIFSIVAKARKKKAGEPANDDWLDDQWQELIQTAEKKVEAPKQNGSPPPLPQAQAVARAPQPKPQHAPLPSEQASQPRRPVARKQAEQPAQRHGRLQKPTAPQHPAHASAPPPVEQSPARFIPSGSSLSREATSVAATSTGADRKARHRAEMKELISGKKALKRAVLMREILDRPRAYDA